MLHLKFATNLDHIADEIIDTVSAHWKSPFNAPAIIFPDPKLEQWFRLRWIQKNKVLANLNKKTIDQFLFEILVGENKNKKKLNADLLRNVMISYLTQKAEDSDKYNYELLGDSVKSYLEAGKISAETANETKWDENRLFDFTSTMAGLFLEYETSRPNGFFFDPDTKSSAEGILDCWKQANLKDFFISKNGKVNDKEDWQRKLYSALFHNNGGKSLLTRVFENLGKESDNEITYLTLPFLFEDCKNENDEVEFNYQSDLPIFIVGLGGMGQFYRVILHEFAKKHDVYAFIQNPCMEFWEDYPRDSFTPQLPSISTDSDNETESFLKEDENDLLRYWGKAGRDNIKLWSMSCDYNSEFKTAQNDTAKSIDADSLLHQIQWAIANRQNKIPSAKNIAPDEEGKYFADDSSLRVTSAPSKIREVEALHTHICKLLNGAATTDGKPAKISDILVISPNIDDYRTAIYQVFDQAKELSDENKSALYIPFSIVDSQATNSLTASALSTLFKLREKKMLSRPDFFSLVRNPVVQQARNINPDEVSSWEKWITEMAIFRDKNSDWIHGVQRLLMGHFSNRSVDIDGETISPYEDFDSSDNNTLYHFVDCVESLEKWVSKDFWPENISREKLDDVIEFLDSWLLMQNPPKGLGGESIIYQSVCEAKKDLKYFYAAGSEEISWKIISQMLMTAAQGSEYSCGNLFVNGLTFMKFTPNRTLPIKYLFILGLDANSFPGVRRTNTLDLRKSVRPWPGDDNPIAKNRYAFLCQLMSSSEGFFISYVNKNLQKDEDFYPSSVVNDIRSFLKNSLPKDVKQENILPATKINLNEDRSWKDLFTLREMRNKKTLNQFQQDFNDLGQYGDSKENKDEYPKHVTIYQFKKFLEDPFQFHACRSLNIDDELEDQEKLEFEPIEIEFLTKYNLKKTQLCIGLGIPENGEIQTTEDFEKYVQGQNILPAEPFRQKEWAEITGSIDEAVNNILSTFPKECYSYSRKEVSSSLVDNFEEENRLSGEEQDTERKWSISGTVKAFIESNDHKEVNFIDFCYGSPKPKHYLSPYIAALVYISSLSNDEVPMVNIRIASFSGNISAPLNINHTPEEASNLLQNIYEKAFIKKFHKVLPLEMFPNQDSRWKYIATLKDTEDIGKNKAKSPWKNFAGKNLFDVEKVCGYPNSSTFVEEWNKDVVDQCNLIPGLKQIIAGDNNEEA